MVFHCQDEEVEWRNPEAALALDLSLVEDVFRRLAKQRRDTNDLKTKQHSSASNASNTNNQSSHVDHSTPRSRDALHPDMLFSKSDVLVTLEQSRGFLQKRKMLRMLHTSLACVSLEKEGASVEGFVRFRVKERTLSFAMARARLLQIFERTERARVFEAQVQEFTQQARAKSLWCVRDWKSRCPKPSQHYGVHVIPLKPKTQKQLDAEQKILENLAAGVVRNAMDLGMQKVVDQVAKARPTSGGKRSARARTPHSAQHDRDNGVTSRNARKGGPSKLALRARTKREQAEMEARCKQLRVQILAPNIENTALSMPLSQTTLATQTSEQEPSPTKDSGGDDGGSDDDARLQDSSQPGEALEKQARAKITRHPSRAAQRQQLLLLLATVEANGDVRIAERLLSQKITNSGFQRAVDQAKNLALARDDHWGLVKIWKTVYRSHTMQSLQAALSKSH